MHLVVTRSFPPEIGGMQNLMWGLTNSLSKHDLIKVFADDHNNAKQFDEKASFTIERVGGPKLIKKYRKSFLVNNYLERNNKINQTTKEITRIEMIAIIETESCRFLGIKYFFAIDNSNIHKKD